MLFSHTQSWERVGLLRCGSLGLSHEQLGWLRGSSDESLRQWLFQCILVFSRNYHQHVLEQEGWWLHCKYRARLA
jgi:hypothetical protein